MALKLLGALCILIACGGYGCHLAWQYQSDKRMLRHVIGVLDFIENELQFRQTPLPELCRISAEECAGPISTVLRQLALELDSRTMPDAKSCMQKILSSHRDIPPHTMESLTLLGSHLGNFDLAGQVRCLDSVRNACSRALEKLTDEKHMNDRHYRTLGLCAGAALIIVFI